MNEIVNQLAQSLFKKNSLQECSRWELEIMADHYPYFGIAQYLLSGKLKEQRAENYDKQLEKTSLFFSNPLWLDYVINNETVLADDKSETDRVVIDNGAVTDVDTHAIEEEHPLLPDLSKAFPAKISEEGNEAVANEPEVDLKNPIAFDQEDPLSDSASYDNEEIDSQDGNPEEEMVMRPIHFEPLKDADIKSSLTFEPYHTVDYFASQGIKVATNEKPKDRFEQQLKSFTQWLKTIKEVSVTEIASEAGVGAEEKVISLAEHSIEDREIVTETMAEVWIKQGNRQKAIEVYDKLSLQNPAKSSYFAGLIEQLKQQ